MSDITIESKFKTLLPPLSEEQKEELEKDILKNGCLNPLVFWNKILIDGHHRYEICTRNNIPFDILKMEFATELEAMEWAWSNQKNRRNLNKYELAQIALKFKPEIEAKAKENLSIVGGDKKSEEVKSGLMKSSKVIEPVNTRKKLAEIAGVSEDTIHKVEVIEEQASEDIKLQVKTGEITINNAYNLTKSAIETKKRNEELEREYQNHLEIEKIKKKEVELQEEFERSLPKNTVVLEKFRKKETYIFGIEDFNNLSKEQFDSCLKHSKKYQDAISKIGMLNVEEDSLKAWNCVSDSKEMIDIELKDISIAIQKLITIQNYFKGVK